jgi:hypothetical protein
VRQRTVPLALVLEVSIPYVVLLLIGLVAPPFPNAVSGWLSAGERPTAPAVALEIALQEVAADSCTDGPGSNSLCWGGVRGVPRTEVIFVAIGAPATHRVRLRRPGDGFSWSINPQPPLTRPCCAPTPGPT